MVSDMRKPGLAARWGTSFLVSALFATMLVFAAGMARAPISVTPSATNTTLCSGYSGCRAAGYSDAGYGAVNDRMYWRMYSGHNCTNYVAYRMIKAGMSTSRPWSGGGNASEWGLQMKSITDQVPNVGAVAWWARYDNGSGSAGHVAYVERVISSTEIIVSQDSWGGTFSWRRISKDSGRWPTGFIHFVDKTIAAKAQPVITGEPVIGSALTASAGKWSVTPSSYAYEWFVDGVSSGVRTRTFVPRPEDRTKAVTVRVTAARTGYTSGVQDSAATAAVIRGSFEVAEAPSVDGDVFVDETLTASAGSWSPEPRAVQWRWYADGRRLTEQVEPTLALTQDLVGKEISMVPLVRQNGYFTTAGSRVVAGTVVIGEIEVTTPFAVRGTRRQGETLTVRDGVTSPADATRSYQWLRDGTPIPGAHDASYRLTADDVAAHMSVQVDVTRRNYASESAVLPTVGVVRSPATIRVVPRAGVGRAAVVVRVTAPGMAPVNGKIRIRVGGWLETVRLVDGRAKVMADVRRGERSIAVRYLGSTIVPSAFATSSVQVR